MPVNPVGRPCRCGSIGCWETEVGRGRAPARGPVARRRRSGRDATPCSADAAGRVRHRRWRRSMTSAAGWASASPRLVNVLNPRLVVLGGRLPASIRSSRAGSRPSSTAGRCRRRAALVRIVPAASGSTPRSSVPRSSPSSRSSPIRPPGSAAPSPRCTWRAHDAGARIALTVDGIHRRHDLRATRVKGVCLAM